MPISAGKPPHQFLGMDTESPLNTGFSGFFVAKSAEITATVGPRGHQLMGYAFSIVQNALITL